MVLPLCYLIKDAVLVIFSLLFEAFNKCDTVASKDLFTKDLEFYHDKGGLTRYEENIRSIHKRCSGNYIVRCELVPGSTEVFPIKDYGAIQPGSIPMLKD